MEEKNQKALSKDESKIQVICITCKRQVEVKPIRFGNGYIAVCPECDKLAYNSRQ